MILICSYPYFRYEVKAGDHDLTSIEKSEQKVRLDKIFVHQGYKHTTYINDIALVKLKEKVELSAFVRTVCLPDKVEGDLAKPTKYGSVCGWGATKALKPREKPERDDRYSTVLKYDSYRIRKNQLCANATTGVVPFNSTVTFCAGDGKGGNDTCKGDSGGAFVRARKRGKVIRWIATGLVSWGEGCAQENHYGYYTRVYSFIDWIKETLDKHTDPDEEIA